jgi:hypothetical protein
MDGNHWVFIEVDGVNKNIIYNDSIRKPMRQVQAYLQPVSDLIQEILKTSVEYQMVIDDKFP